MDSGVSDDFLDLLALEPLRDGVFIGRPSVEERWRVFGGHLLAQALAAAALTVEGKPCHSLHAYFLRPGKPGRPIEYEVGAMRDGFSFVTRKVLAVQRDEVTLELIASFQHDEPGPEHQRTMPDTPPPESFPDEQTRLSEMLSKAPAAIHDTLRRKRPIEMIRVDGHPMSEHAPGTAPIRTWLRARQQLPDEANVHRAVLAYCSDVGALEPSMRATGANFRDPAMQVASLDHALWFHRPFRCDDWLLYVYENDSVAFGRGLSHGSVYTRDGVLVASIAQEGVMRLRKNGAA